MQHVRRQDLRGSWRRTALEGREMECRALGEPAFTPRTGTSKQQPATTETMGKGDRKTRRGKINRASYGKNRKRKVKKKTKTGTRAS